MDTNRHPIDRMAELKSQIAALQTEYDGLRDALLRGDFDAVGDQHVAQITEVERTWVSVKIAEQILKPEVLNRITTTSVSTKVIVRPR